MSRIAKGTIEALEAFWDIKAHRTDALYDILMTIAVSLLIALLAGLPDTQLCQLLPGGEKPGGAFLPCRTIEKHWLQHFGRRKTTHERMSITAKHCLNVLNEQTVELYI